MGFEKWGGWFFFFGGGLFCRGRYFKLIFVKPGVIAFISFLYSLGGFC